MTEPVIEEWNIDETSGTLTLVSYVDGRQEVKAIESCKVVRETELLTTIYSPGSTYVLSNNY